MGTAAELLAAFEGVNLREMVELSVNSTSEEYADLNRAQLVKGQRSDGRKVMDRPGGPYRSTSYARMKQGMNGEAGLFNPDLKLTGAFHRGIAMELQGDAIMVESSDGKAGELESRYGGTIYGLNEKNQQQYNEQEFLPVLLSQIEKQTGLKAKSE